MAQLIPVRCVVCGHPTGRVCDPVAYNVLSQADQTCSNCISAARAQQGVTTCPNCDENTLHVRRNDVFDGTLARDEDGTVYVQTGYMEDTSFEVTCGNCGFYFDGTHFSSVEFE